MKPPSPAKQVLVVRKDLKMRKGKIAAQCAHASLRVMLQAMDRTVADDERQWTLRFGADTPWASWLEGQFTKVCVYVESEDELLAVAARAEELAVPYALITDSGRTEFGGVPTRTVLAVGPDWRPRIDEVTGGLPLL